MRHNNKATNKMKLWTFICLTCALIFCVLVAFFRSNIVFNQFKFNPDGNYLCTLSVFTSYIFYITSKFAMYILFTYRLEIVFGNSMYAVSDRVLSWFRGICIALFILCIIPFYLVPKQKVITLKYNISLCTNDVGLDGDTLLESLTNYAIIAYIFVDFVVSMVLLYLFCSKLYQMSKMYSNVSSASHDGSGTGTGTERQEKIDNIKQIESQLIKQTILVSTGVISTFFFAFIGSFVLWTVGWFIPLDMTFNSLSIYLMYKFANNAYQLLCKPCILSCKCCIKYVYGIHDKELFTMELDVANESQQTTTKNETSMCDI